jgi:hypothetical protein
MKTKFRRVCFKLLLLAILTSLLPFYPYQKDERALPGYPLTRCPFYPLHPDVKFLSLLPAYIYVYSCAIFPDSLSLSTSKEKTTYIRPVIYSQ